MANLKSLRATIALQTPLGTPLSGDTLFGQFCWAARERFGNDRLRALLEGYTSGSPWLVVSDGFPHGYLPRPTVPQSLQPAVAPEQRKLAKGKRWIPLDRASLPLAEMLSCARDDNGAWGTDSTPIRLPAHHNTLNRQTGTTGTGEFAPYTQAQTFVRKGQLIDFWMLLDEARAQLLNADELRQLLEDIGLTGFGRDASIGLGKFTVDVFTAESLPRHPRASALWTLAPCAPQGCGYDSARSHWQARTRFGRHGNRLALGGQPFKKPILLAATGAVFRLLPGQMPSNLAGRGLGGDGSISKAEPATVHQGYAPAVGICIGDPQ